MWFTYPSTAGILGFIAGVLAIGFFVGWLIGHFL